MNTEVNREPVSPEKIKDDLNAVFTFNPPLTKEHLASCEKIQNACKALAQAIADEVPEGKEQTVAINNLLATALWSRHGITRRQVLVVGVTVPPHDTNYPEPRPVESSLPEAQTSVPADPTLKEST